MVEHNAAAAPEYLTEEKYEALKNELTHLKTERRKEMADKLEYAKSLGDLAENAEYHSAREEQASLEDRIGRLEQLLRNATVVSSKKGDHVTVGAKVDVRKKGSQSTHSFTIVGAEE